MGYQNARKVILHWGDLPGNAYKVLNAMAWASMDERPEWWGEPARLAMALGRNDWPRDNDRRPKANAARKRCLARVAEALHQLEDAGAIVVDQRPRGTRRGIYILTLDPVDNPVDNAVDNPLSEAALSHGFRGNVDTDSVAWKTRKPCHLYEDRDRNLSDDDN